MSNGQAQKKAEKPKKKFAEVVPEPTKKTELEQKVKLLTKEMKKLNNQLDNWFELLDWYRDYYGAPSDWSQEYFVYAMLTAGGKPQQEMLGLLEDVNKTLAKKEKLFKKLEGLGLSNFTATQNQKIKNQYLDLYWLKGPKWEAIIDTTTQMVEDKLKELEPKPLTSEEGGPTISGQKGPVIPWKERPPDLTLPVYGDLVFLFPGVPEVYIDSSCGPNPVDAATLEICRTYEAIEMGDVELKKQLKEKQNMIMDAIILMIPVVGSVYMIGLDVHEIKSKKELVKHAEELQKELDKNRDIMTDADILMTEMLIQQYKDAAPNWKDYAWLAFDFVGLGLDAAFATQILVRTTARWKGTKALKVLEAEGGVGKTTQVEKDLFAQAAVELGEQAEDMYNIAAKKKGGWYQVSTELAEDAKKAKAAGKGDGTITKQIMLDYIEKNPIQKSGKLKKVGQKALDLTVGDLGAMGGKKNFYKKMVQQFYRELIPNINFKAVSDMSDLMKKAHLPAKLQKKALSAIFYSMMTFNKEAQAALLKLVKEKGWEYVAKKIVKKETQLAKAGVKLKPGEDILGKATRDVLAEEVPAYKIAYAEAPLVPLVENGMIMTGTHAVFALIGQYIAADQKEQLEIEEDIVALMEEMEEPMEFQVQWESEAEIRGRVLKAVESGME